MNYYPVEVLKNCIVDLSRLSNEMKGPSDTIQNIFDELAQKYPFFEIGFYEDTSPNFWFIILGDEVLWSEIPITTKKEDWYPEGHTYTRYQALNESYFLSM